MTDKPSRQPKRSHVAAYLAARERRDNEEAERYDLARSARLEECSPKRG